MIVVCRIKKKFQRKKVESLTLLSLCVCLCELKVSLRTAAQMKG